MKMVKLSEVPYGAFFRDSGEIHRKVRLNGNVGTNKKGTFAVGANEDDDGSRVYLWTDDDDTVELLGKDKESIEGDFGFDELEEGQRFRLSGFPNYEYVKATPVVKGERIGIYDGYKLTRFFAANRCEKVS